MEFSAIYMIMVQPTSFAFFCVFVSAYHRLFNLVVDGHNASTRGTAEERRRKKNGAINKQLKATTADQQRH